MLVFAIVLLLLVTGQTVWAEDKVTLEVQPATVDASPWYERAELRVILRNGSSDDLSRVRLTAFTNDAFTVKVDPLAVVRLRPLEAAVWTARLEGLGRARMPGAIQFEASYGTAKAPGTQRAYATLTVKPQGLADKPIEVTVQGAFDAVTETRPGTGLLIVKNNLDVPVTVADVAVFLPDAETFLAPPPFAHFDVLARSMESRVVTLAAGPRVAPGKHTVAFVVKAEWDEGGHHHVRQLAVDKEVTAGVFFESEVLKVLGVPSFLLMPGALFLFTMQLFVTLGVLGVGRYSKVPEVSVTSPGFWIAATTFSGLFAWVYARATGTDYLVRYGARDLRNVWLWSIALGVATFVLLALITRRRRQQRVPDTRDDQITTLEKMGRRGQGILTNRVRFPMNNVTIGALMLEPIEDGQTMVWVAPRIVTTWANSNEALAAQEQVRQLIDQRADAEQLARALRVARDAQPAQVAISWETQGSVPNPYHLKVESIAEYAAPEPLVGMN
jgi:hypothetical protein